MQLIKINKELNSGIARNAVCKSHHNVSQEQRNALAVHLLALTLTSCQAPVVPFGAVWNRICIKALYGFLSLVIWTNNDI